MAATTLLAGDMGGTKTLLALYRLDGSDLEVVHQHRFASSEWPSLEPMLQAFLNNRPEGTTAPTYGCIAVAGPVRNGSARITNLPWHLEERALAEAAALHQLELVNDFSVLIYGLPRFDATQQVVLQEGTRDGGPLAC